MTCNYQVIVRIVFHYIHNHIQYAVRYGFDCRLACVELYSVQSLFEYFEHVFLDSRAAFVFLYTLDSGAFVFVVGYSVAVCIFRTAVFVYETSHFFRCVRTFILIVGYTVAVTVLWAAVFVYGYSVRSIGTLVFVVRYAVAVAIYRTTVYIDRYTAWSIRTLIEIVGYTVAVTIYRTTVCIDLYTLRSVGAFIHIISYTVTVCIYRTAVFVDRYSARSIRAFVVAVGYAVVVFVESTTVFVYKLGAFLIRTFCHQHLYIRIGTSVSVVAYTVAVFVARRFVEVINQTGLYVESAVVVRYRYVFDIVFKLLVVYEAGIFQLYGSERYIVACQIEVDGSCLYAYT